MKNHWNTALLYGNFSSELQNARKVSPSIYAKE